MSHQESATDHLPLRRALAWQGRDLEGSPAGDLFGPCAYGHTGFTGTVRQRRFDAYASVNRTCELGMSRATGANYRHLLELVEVAAR
jgi:hypothetical protein